MATTPPADEWRSDGEWPTFCLCAACIRRLITTVMCFDRAWLSKVSLGVAQAASDDPRKQRDHRGGGKHNYGFHNFG